MERSVLAELERAELASRARRLVAATEADGRVDAAREEADRIRASTRAEVERAVAVVRARHAEAAGAAIAAAETELARAAAPTIDDPGTVDPRFEAVVDEVVAAVLGEREA